MFGIREMECSTEDAFSYCLKNTGEESQSVVMIKLFCVEQSEIGKNEGEAFQAVKTLVCDLAFSPSPSLPSWAPRD